MQREGKNVRIERHCESPFAKNERKLNESKFYMGKIVDGDGLNDTRNESESPCGVLSHGSISRRKNPIIKATYIDSAEREYP